MNFILRINNILHIWLLWPLKSVILRGNSIWLDFDFKIQVYRFTLILFMMCQLLDQWSYSSSFCDSDAGHLWIPFTVKDGLIYVKATISGKLVTCCLDTGSNVLVWHENSNFLSSSVGAPEVLKAPGGNSISGTAVYLQTVSLGTFTVNNVYSLKIRQSTDKDDTRQSFTKGHNGNLPEIVIGTNLFCNSVVVIDYPRHRLLVGPSTNRSNRLPQTFDAKIFRMKFVNGNGNSPGCPSVQVKIKGHSVSAVLDTGCNSIVIKSHYVKDLLSNKTMQSMTYLGYTTGYDIKDMSIEFGGMVVKSNAVAMKDIGGVDMVLGYELLKHFVITLDFGNRNIIFIGPQ